MKKTIGNRSSKAMFRGFTLVELIVVITILAILATIGFLALSGYSQDAKDSAIKANVRSVQTAISSESALTNNSPRYYVVHDTGAALSGAFVYVDGVQTTLTGGDWNVSGTNYSAGNPDYAKLKMNPEKFKVSASGLPSGTLGIVARAAGIWTADAAYDSRYLAIGAMDAISASTANGKARSVSYFQVAGVSPATGAVSVSWNFPASSGSVAGLVKDPKSSSSTGALVDGWTSGVSVPVVCNTPGYVLVGGACLPNSCGVIKTAYPTSPDGAYSIDPDGTGPTPAFAVFCDMTTDGGGWTMVYKKSSGVVSANPTNDFVGGALNESDASLLNRNKSATKDYSNRLTSSFWSNFTSARVEAVTGGAVQKFMKYSLAGTNNSNWYAKSKLVDSSYTDLVSGAQNFYSIAGDTTYGRTFYINNVYGGCPGDVGWFIISANTGSACSWEVANTVKYSNAATGQNWNSASAADAFVILLK